MIFGMKSPEVVRICQTNNVSKSRCQELCDQLKVDEACDKEEKLKVKELLLRCHDIFALCD